MRGEFEWPRGKRVAVSMSFDDARPSQVDVGVPILDAHGVKATFYATIDRLEVRRDKWLAAHANGHEIGNHSLNHACSGNFGWRKARVLETYSLEVMEEELVEANRRLGEFFGAAPRTFAYPCGQTFVGRGLGRRSYVPVVAKHFVVGRGFRDEHYNDPSFCDLAKVGGTEFDGVDFDGLVTITERAASLGLWVVLAGHDVGDPGHQRVVPDVLDRFCAYCRDPGNGVWVDTVAAIGEYVRQRQRESALPGEA